VPKKLHFRCDARASFATAFSNWRRQNNVPLKKIAKDLGVSMSTISSWELGKRFPGGYNFEMLVEYTGLPPCKLFCIMADKCVPADCMLVMRRSPARRG
jgi:transcriptional regulator with XRE-family HTH domain